MSLLKRGRPAATLTATSDENLKFIKSGSVESTERSVSSGQSIDDGADVVVKKRINQFDTEGECRKGCGGQIGDARQRKLITGMISNIQSFKTCGRCIPNTGEELIPMIRCGLVATDLQASEDGKPCVSQQQGDSLKRPRLPASNFDTSIGNSTESGQYLRLREQVPVEVPVQGDVMSGNRKCEEGSWWRQEFEWGHIGL
jgi:hypothetical protein